MQLSKSMIQQIIKEELANVLAEAEGPAQAVRKKDWPTVASLAAKSAEAGFPKSNPDITREKLLTHQFLKRLSHEIEDGGEKTLKDFARALERMPKVRKEIGAVWIQALNPEPHDD